MGFPKVEVARAKAPEGSTDPQNSSGERVQKIKMYKMRFISATRELFSGRLRHWTHLNGGEITPCIVSQ